MRSSFTLDQINFIKQKADSLPEIEKKIVRSIFWNGCTEWELSEQLGINPYEVFAIKRRALKSLEKIYKKEFAGEEPLVWSKTRRALA